MKIPFRLDVLRRLTNALEEVSFSVELDEDGPPVEHVMTDAVFRGRVQFGEDDKLPLLSILEVPMQPEGLFSGSSGALTKGQWELVVQGFIDDNFRHPTDAAHFFMAAVKKRLIEARRTRDDAGIFGYKEIENLTFNSGVVRPPDDTSAVAHFWLTVYLELVEDVSDPYIES